MKTTKPPKPDRPEKPKPPKKPPTKKPPTKKATPKKKEVAKKPSTKALVAAPAKVKKSKVPARDPSNFAFVFDTETTGLVQNRKIALDKQPEIVEFYGCLVDLTDGHIVEEFETFLKPKRPIGDDTIKIHGITNEMVSGAPAFKEVAKSIQEIVTKAPVVIAHNLKFDIDMVEIEFERLGAIIDWPRKLCTVEQTEHIKGYRLNLSALHEHLFGEKFSGAHRARVDVQALVRCCVELRKRDLV